MKIRTEGHLNLRSAFRDLLRPTRVLSPEEAYGLWASSYDDRDGNAVLFLEEQVMLPLLSKYVLPGKRVVDFGSGTGRHILHCLTLGATSVVGIEASMEMLNVAKKKLPRLQAELIQARIEELPLIGSTFDVGITSLVLSHIEDLRSTISEMSRVLRPNGILLVADLHWTFNERGWKRTFRSNLAPGKRLAVRNYSHTLADYRVAFAGSNLRVENMLEPPIDERIRAFYADAQMEKTYERDRGLPLLVVFQLRKQ